MAYKRLTITFPTDLVVKVQRCVRGRGFSTYLAEAAREKLSRDDRSALKKRLSESYRKSGVEDLAMAREWDSTTIDGI